MRRASQPLGWYVFGQNVGGLFTLHTLLTILASKTMHKREAGECTHFTQIFHHNNMVRVTRSVKKTHTPLRTHSSVTRVLDFSHENSWKLPLTNEIYTSLWVSIHDRCCDFMIPRTLSRIIFDGDTTKSKTLRYNLQTTNIKLKYINPE